MSRRHAIPFLLLQIALFTFGPAYCRALMAGGCDRSEHSCCVTPGDVPASAPLSSDDGCPIHDLDQIRAVPSAAGREGSPEFSGLPGIGSAVIREALPASTGANVGTAAPQAVENARPGRTLLILNSVFRL